MRILGIDPGLNTTGYGVLEVVEGKPRLVEAGIIRGKTRGSVTARVREIFQGVTDVIESLQPEVLALEKLYSHYDRPTTAIMMGHARGVICLAAAQAEIEVEDYAATQVKKTLTGNGRAPKSQMQQADTARVGIVEAARAGGCGGCVGDCVLSLLCGEGIRGWGLGVRGWHYWLAFVKKWTKYCFIKLRSVHDFRRCVASRLLILIPDS